MGGGRRYQHSTRHCADKACTCVSPRPRVSLPSRHVSEGTSRLVWPPSLLPGPQCLETTNTLQVEGGFRAHAVTFEIFTHIVVLEPGFFFYLFFGSINYLRIYTTYWHYTSTVARACASCHRRIRCDKYQSLASPMRRTPVVGIRAKFKFRP